MDIQYRIIPKSNVIAKSQNGLEFVIKTILCDVEAKDKNGNVVYAIDLLTVLPEPQQDTYTSFNEITEEMMINWIETIDTINYDSVKDSLAWELKTKQESNVIVDGKLPWQTLNY